MSRGLWSTTGLGKGAFLDAVAHVVPPKIDSSPAADRPAAGHDQDLLIGPHVVQDLIDCHQAPLGRRRRYTGPRRRRCRRLRRISSEEQPSELQATMTLTTDVVVL